MLLDEILRVCGRVGVGAGVGPTWTSAAVSDGNVSVDVLFASVLCAAKGHLVTNAVCGSTVRNSLINNRSTCSGNRNS